MSKFIIVLDDTQPNIPCKVNYDFSLGPGETEQNSKAIIIGKQLISKLKGPNVISFQAGPKTADNEDATETTPKTS